MRDRAPSSACLMSGATPRTIRGDLYVEAPRDSARSPGSSGSTSSACSCPSVATTARTGATALDEADPHAGDAIACRFPFCVIPRGLRSRSERACGMRIAGRKRTPCPASSPDRRSLLWFLGLSVAEGCMHESREERFITISGDDESARSRRSGIFRRELRLHVVRSAEVQTIGRAGRSSSILGSCCVCSITSVSRRRKRIPGWILGLPLHRLKWFLEGYREGDGRPLRMKLRGRDLVMSSSTVSDELKDDLVVAFARFGLVLVRR